MYSDLEIIVFLGVCFLAGVLTAEMIKDILELLK